MNLYFYNSAIETGRSLWSIGDYKFDPYNKHQNLKSQIIYFIKRCQKSFL